MNRQSVEHFGLVTAQAAPRWFDSLRGYPLQAFLVCLGGLSFIHMDQALFVYASTGFKRDLGISIDTYGLILTIGFAVSGLLVPLAGMLADRLGRKRMFQFSIFATAVFVTLQALATSATSLALFRTLGLAAGNSVHTIANTLSVEVAPARWRGLMTGLLQTGYSWGWFLGALVAAPLLAHFGWRAVFLLGLIIIPYALVVKRFLRESERFKQQRRDVGSEMRNARFKHQSGIVHEATSRSGLRQLFQPDLRRRTILLFLGAFLHTAAYGGSAFFLPLYFQQERGLSASTATLLVGSAYAVGILGYALSATIGEFVLPRRDTLIIWSFLGAAAFLLLIWSGGSLPWIVLCFGLMTMFFYGCMGVMSTLIAESFPTRVRATGVGFSGALAISLGIATFPVIVGAAIERLGWNQAFSLFVAVPLVLSGLTFLGLERIPSGIELEEIAQ